MSFKGKPLPMDAGVEDTAPGVMESLWLLGDSPEIETMLNQGIV